MKDYILLGDVDVPIKVVKSRGNRIGLHFSSRGAVLEIRTPTARLGRQERQAIKANREWILTNFARRQSVQEARDDLRLKIIEGEVPYMGDFLPLHEHTSTSQVRIAVKEGGIHMTLPEGTEGAARMVSLYQGLRTLARQTLPPIVREIAARAEVQLNDIRVKDTKTRWGSCSSKRNINLNWHLIMLRKDLIEYLVIHELMHLHEMNHSERYWKWVEKFCPDYKRLDKELSSHEWMIGIFDPWVKPDRSD